jgi:hypothetical protein
MLERNGNVMARSTLGDPQTFAEIECKAKTETPAARILRSFSEEGRDTNFTTKRKSVKPQKAAPPATDITPKDLSERPDAYISKLRSLQDAMLTTRTRTNERTLTIAKFLPIYEQTSMNKEASILANWQERQKEWERIQTDIGRRVSAPKVIAIYFINIAVAKVSNCEK